MFTQVPNNNLASYWWDNLFTACEDYANSEWKLKGTNCGKFCVDLLYPEIICEDWRYTMGCFCKDGYYRDKNLQCIMPEECGEDDDPNDPPQPSEYPCPVNEMYDNCSSRCLELCKNREDPLVCPIDCNIGCFCRGARLRNNMGECVPVDECEPLNPDRPKPVCPKGEMFMECGNRCQELCPNTRKAFGLALDCDKCQSGCFCEPGLLRSKIGACVKPERCDRRSIVVNVVSSIFNVIFSKFRFGIQGRGRFSGSSRFNAGFGWIKRWRFW